MQRGTAVIDAGPDQTVGNQKNGLQKEPEVAIEELAVSEKPAGSNLAQNIAVAEWREPIPADLEQRLDELRKSVERFVSQRSYEALARVDSQLRLAWMDYCIHVTSPAHSLATPQM